MSQLSLQRQNDAFLDALQREAAPDGVQPAGAAVQRRPQLPTTGVRPLRERNFDLEIGEADTGGPVGLTYEKLMAGRLLIQGVSGAGKSWTLRRLLEQSARGIQQIVLDPEGELVSLADDCGLAVIDGAKLDPAGLATAATRVRMHRVPVLLDLSDLERERQMVAVASFLEPLVAATREHWHPALVAIDEAHLFAPFGGQGVESTHVRKRAIAAVTDLMSRGRKRGLCGVLATQRIARLAKSVASEIHNFLIGLNTLDLDIRRAAETIGWDARRGFDRLPELSPGDFVAVGPAFSRSPCVLRVGGIETEHRGEPPAVSAAPEIAPDQALGLLDLEALEEASAEEERERNANLAPGFRAVRAVIRDAAFADAGVIWRELAALSPDGASVADIPQALGLPADRVSAALELLDRYGALEFSEDGAARHVRAAPGMVQP